MKKGDTKSVSSTNGTKSVDAKIGMDLGTGGPPRDKSGRFVVKPTPTSGPWPSSGRTR